MNLVCPHCAKVVDIPQELAGKTTTCPQCAGPFTVPLVPPDLLLPAPPKETKAEEKTERQGSVAQSTGEEAAKPTEGAVPKELPGLTHVSTVSASGVETSAVAGSRTFAIPLVIPRELLPFIAPVSLVLLVGLLFLPWVGIYAGNTTLAEQSGWGVTFGFISTHPKLKTPVEGVGMSMYLFLHFLCLCAALLIVGGVLAAKYPRPVWQQRLSRIGPSLIAWRLQLLVILTLLGFLFILMLSFVPLPFEREMTGKQVQNVLRDGMQIKFDVEPKNPDTDIVELQWVRRSPWFTIALLLNLLAFLGALADWYCARYPNRPLPHLEIIWAKP
jgi:hypothetical protein